MKYLGVAILSSVVAFSLVACSSSSTEKPAADPTNAAASTNAPAPAAPAAPAAPVDKPAPPKMVAVPEGTALEVVLTDGLSSSKNKSGDTFTGSLGAPVVIDGATVLSKGTKVHGRVVDAKESGRVKGLASLSLALTDIAQGEKKISIVTKDWVEEAQSTKKKDTGIIGGAAGIGAAIGAIAGGKKGAAEGAAIGGGAGTGTVLATKGKEVELAPESTIHFALGKTIEVSAPKKG